jgi:hypothetical protein
MSTLQSLENSLDDVFAKKAPALPEGGKKALVEWLPWINLVFGVLTLLSALSLWRWAHSTNALVDYANSLSSVYGGETIATSRMDVAIWLGLAVLVVQGALMLAAFSPTKDRKKAGWNLMFYAALLNFAYGIVTLFSDYSYAGGVVGTLLGTAIAFYLLFQIRSAYKLVPAAKKA